MHAPGVDPDYFIWRLYGSYYGDYQSYITQGIEDLDKNYAIGFNPVDDSTLSNIYRRRFDDHDWNNVEYGPLRLMMPKQGGHDISSSVRYSVSVLGPLTANVTTDPTANPWVFTVTYHDAYNDYAWGRGGRTTGYIYNVLATLHL